MGRPATSSPYGSAPTSRRCPSSPVPWWFRCSTSTCFGGCWRLPSGIMVGGLVIALASAQGPRMGIPQMVQSRGQFGRYGALLIVFFAALIYIGFFISNIVLAGKSIVGIAPSVPVPASILIGRSAPPRSA